MTKDTPEPLDYGTPELSRRKTVKPILVGKGHSFRLQVLDGCEIDRLLTSRLITLDEYNTLDRFSKDLHVAALTGVRASTYEYRVTSGDNQGISDEVAERRVKINNIIKDLDDNLGLSARRLLIDVCTDQAKADVEQVPLVKDGVEVLNQFFVKWSKS